MEFHINRSLRERLGLDDILFSYTGNVVFANVAASRKLAAQLNALRAAAGGRAEVVNAGTLFAMGLIDELSHAVVAKYRKEIDPDVLAEALRWFAAKVGPKNLEGILLGFTQEFPNSAVFSGRQTAMKWLAGTTEDLPNREAALEELMMLWLANANPAFAEFQELFGDERLKQQTSYRNVTASLPEYFVERPPARPDGKSLFDVLREPALASPDSIKGQLDFIRENWVEYLGEDLKQVLLAIDVMREEDVAIWMRFHPAVPGRFGGEPGWQAHGFVGDEFVGFDDDFGEYVTGPDGVRRKREYSADHQAPLNEYEAFSADYAWMPTVVMMAKSTYVWLEQLSQKYLRHIHRLDQIPDEELALMAERGMTALWLIGLWERSVASQTIKRLRGNADAVASAYSLKEYDIAADLGGNAAYEALRDKASRYGIRLASDMVPNHMGIDSNWVIEHPEWFVSRDHSPFPVYSFEGPDLAADSRVEIKIEDHYYDQTDAAVAFRLRSHRDGTTKFLYHGNDGTTFAWNDTAQLDYSKAAVREHVIQVILHVARLFPIIRFDAAMVLAKRHVQRLWFPLPGVGGSIPSRAENAMSQEEFDALMPNEFWREVVDRVAAEVPGTLLLAEAFWLLEGYFVRTLGMHRVYNSAFMNMLRDEENAKYRSYLKKTIEFDPDILKRYVNFMSNPDERTAADQFGGGDKYFGTCVLLATLPGLPMFAHGQIEGFNERYGMDFKQARLKEHPNQGLIERYNREITPLLKSRHVFAESTNFVLYDFWNEHGAVDENVLAYSNRSGDERALIVYNNVYESTRGTVHISAASVDKGSGELRQRSLTDALGLWPQDGKFVAYRDPIQGLEFLRRANDLYNDGLTVNLHGYQYLVLRHWRELWASAEQPWDKLHDALHGQGVSHLDEALKKLRFRTVHEALRGVVSTEMLKLMAQTQRWEQGNAPAMALAEPEVMGKPEVEEVSEEPLALPEETLASEKPLEVKEEQSTEALLITMRDRVKAFYTEVEKHLGGAPEIAVTEQAGSAVKPKALWQALSGVRFGAETVFPWPSSGIGGLAPMLAWAVLADLPAGVGGLNAFDELDLRSALAEVFGPVGLSGEDAWRAAGCVRVLLAGKDDNLTERLATEAFWADADVRWLAGVSEAGGVTYFNKERFEALLNVMELPSLVAGEEGDTAVAEGAPRLAALRGQAEEAGYRVDVFRAKMLAGAESADLVASPRDTLKEEVSLPRGVVRPAEVLPVR